MAAAVAGEILGPRPGLAIVSFSQGIVEIALRVVAAVTTIPALVAAIVSIATLSINGSGNMAALSNNSSDDMSAGIFGSGGCIVGVADLAILYVLLVIILRFCNIGLVNIKINIFIIVDVVINLIFCVAFIGGGVAEAVYAVRGRSANFEAMITNSLIVSSAFSLLAAIWFVVLAVWMLIYMVKDWNNEVVKYTLKKAVIG